MNQLTISNIQSAYLDSDAPWFLGFSGGKDSSCLLALTYNALSGLRNFHKFVTVIYVETGVDIPIIARHTSAVLRAVKRQATRDGLPIDIAIARPPVADRYFVKVIGRGYVTPTNKFRWCTDRLRIDPIKRLLAKKAIGKYTVLLGTRLGESAERDRTLIRHRTDVRYHFRQQSNPNATIYSPIVDYSVNEVWSTLINNRQLQCLKAKDLKNIYQSASGECPTIRDPKGTPCGKGRFGCWTCTVVRQDKAVSGLIASGYRELQPLLTFRNWLSEIRDNAKYRCKRRRNGCKGLGPFTLSARKMILRRLLQTQNSVPWRLISAAEISAIRKLWEDDIHSDDYKE
ncbi:MAG: phosphoadenosine phosphosulfate reductase family protein [Candidatus Udaeobacter sp.]